MNRGNDIKKSRRSKLSRRLLLEYLLSLVVYAVALCAFVLIAWQFFSSLNWDLNSLLYRLLHTVQEYLLFFAGFPLVAGMILISYYFLSRPLKYLDEVVEAAEALSKPDCGVISLSPAMLDTQNELNLVREQAQQAAAVAREAEQRKNDLIVYLAHDLKTPLTSVIGYLSLLQDEPDISPQLRARYTGVALDKALRLEELINEFFDITRFNLSAIELERENVNLTRLLEQTAFEFEPALKERGLECMLDLEKDLMVYADADKLARVFDNLLRNAANYSYPDSIINLRMKRNGERICVQVKNRGKTIAPAKLSRIFEQFFRLDSSRSSATGGAGLGLAIARELVEKHGGSIRAESFEENIIFTVELPCAPLQ